MSEQGDEAPQDKSWIWKLAHLNPARWITLVVAVAALLSAFGFTLSGEQTQALTGLIVALTAIVQGVWTESKTTANKKVVVKAPDPVDNPNVVVPGDAVTTAKPGEILDAATQKP
jgi:hypothetical protein